MGRCRTAAGKPHEEMLYKIQKTCNIPTGVAYYLHEEHKAGFRRG